MEYQNFKQRENHSETLCVCLQNNMHPDQAEVPLVVHMKQQEGKTLYEFHNRLSAAWTSNKMPRKETEPPFINLLVNHSLSAFRGKVNPGARFQKRWTFCLKPMAIFKLNKKVPKELTLLQQLLKEAQVNQ